LRETSDRLIHRVMLRNRSLRISTHENRASEWWPTRTIEAISPRFYQGEALRSLGAGVLRSSHHPGKERRPQLDAALTVF
jgi:hypothetical protein